jgi:signal transduction histidine kinase/ligand-binding sensor domain-containing protein/CheY-like chemotaxis protein
LLPSLACATQLPLTFYDQANGLTSLSVIRLIQDGQGSIFAGTEKGLYRFDGVGFNAIGSEQGFETSEVISFAEDSTGHLWVASRAGLQRRDRDGQFHWVRPGGRLLMADRGQTLAADEQGGMLVVSGHRLYRLSQDASGDWQVAAVFTDAQLRAGHGLDQVTAVFHRAGSSWFGCGDQLCRLTAGQLAYYGPELGVPADRWLGFLGARDGSVWVRGIHTVRSLAAGANAFVAHDIPGGHAQVAASSIDLIQDRAGRILTRTDMGIARWDGRHWELFDTGNGLPGVGVSSLLADQDGMVWIGTYGRGILYWNSADAVENWTAAQGLGDSLIWSIARADANAIWVADETGGEVLVPAQGRAHRWPLAVPPPNQAHAVLVDGQGAIWYFLFDGRVLRYQPDSGRTTPMAVLPYLVRGAYLDHGGNIWAYTLGGLYQIDAASGQVTRAAPELIPQTMCSDLAEDAAGRLWLGCSSGLFRHNASGWTKVSVQPAEALGGYENVAVTSDGKLWLSSLQPGLMVGHVTDADHVDAAAVADPLLADTRFYFLRPDRRGRLWAGGGNGVDVYDGHRWSRLSTRDGLLWEEANHGAFYADDDGTVWIGTPVGLTHVLKPDQLLAPRLIHPLIFAARYGEHQFGARSPVLPFEAAGALVLRFGVIGNSAGNPVHFRYRLPGVDRDWVETAQREVRYASLPSGSYRFELQAVDTNRRSVSDLVALSFEIAPPWWRTPWAYAGAVLLVLALMALAWQWRVSVLVRHARRLEGLVDERTAELQQSLRSRSMLLAHISHDLRSPLSAILDSVRQWRAGLGQRDHPREIERHVRQQMALIDELLEFSRGELIQLELVPAPGYLFGFLQRLEVDALLLSERQGNRLDYAIDADLPAIVVADFPRLRQIVLNLLGNAAKFTREGSIRCRVGATSHEPGRVHLSFTVEDTGIGLGPDVAERLSQPFVRGGNAAQHQGNGLGLAIVTQLLQRMGSRLDAQGIDAGGSRFSFELELATATEADIEPVLEAGGDLAEFDGEGRSILVVEHVPEIRALLCDLLDGCGFATVAMDASTYDPLDLVLAGQGVSDEDSGTWLETVRARYPGVPVLLYAAKPPSASVQAACDAVLLKPASASELLAAISRLIGVAAATL